MIYTIVTTEKELRHIITSSGIVPSSVIMDRPDAAEVIMRCKTPEFLYDARGVAGVARWRYIQVKYVRQIIELQDTHVTIHNAEEVKEVRSEVG